MEEKTLKIGGGKPEAFLVCDKSLADCKAPFFNWLQGEGFTFGGYHGNYGCWWVHINITRKQYAYGMPGVSLALPIGNHAITIDEFKTIYATMPSLRSMKGRSCSHSAMSGLIMMPDQRSLRSWWILAWQD